MRKYNSIQKHDHNNFKKLNDLTKLLHNIKECPAQNTDSKTGVSRHMKGCGAVIPTKIYLRNYRIYV